MRWEGITGLELHSMATEAFDALAAVVEQIPRAIDPGLAELVRRRVRALLGLTADEAVASTGPAFRLGGRPAEAGLTQRERICLEVAEQFVLDVAATTDAQRAALTDALRGDSFAYIQALYAIDWSIRLELALDQLFDIACLALPRPSTEPDGLWPALEAFMRVVARLDRLDATTTEFVRLRGARAHDCRVCKSRRHIEVVEAGTTEASFDDIDRYESSELPERIKVALRLTDAIIWQPAAFPPELPLQVRTTFAPAEAVEVVFDVARNAANKIAVALGADQPNVAGIEYFGTDADGGLILGVSPGRLRSR